MATHKYKRGKHGSLYVPGEEISCKKLTSIRNQNKEKIECPKNHIINVTNLFVQVVQTSFEH